MLTENQKTCPYCSEFHETKTCPDWIEDELDNRKEDEELWSFADLAKMIDEQVEHSELKGFNEGIDEAIKIIKPYRVLGHDVVPKNVYIEIKSAILAMKKEAKT